MYELVYTVQSCNFAFATETIEIVCKSGKPVDFSSNVATYENNQRASLRRQPTRSEPAFVRSTIGSDEVERKWKASASVCASIYLITPSLKVLGSNFRENNVPCMVKACYLWNNLFVFVRFMTYCRKGDTDAIRLANSLFHNLQLLSFCGRKY